MSLSPDPVRRPLLPSHFPLPTRSEHALAFMMPNTNLVFHVKYGRAKKAENLQLKEIVLILQCSSEREMSGIYDISRPFVHVVTPTVTPVTLLRRTQVRLTNLQEFAAGEFRRL